MISSSSSVLAVRAGRADPAQGDAGRHRELRVGPSPPALRHTRRARWTLTVAYVGLTIGIGTFLALLLVRVSSAVRILLTRRPRARRGRCPSWSRCRSGTPSTNYHNGIFNYALTRLHLGDDQLHAARDDLLELRLQAHALAENQATVDNIWLCKILVLRRESPPVAPTDLSYDEFDDVDVDRDHLNGATSSSMRRAEVTQSGLHGRQDLAEHTPGLHARVRRGARAGEHRVERGRAGVNANIHVRTSRGHIASVSTGAPSLDAVFTCAATAPNPCV